MVDFEIERRFIELEKSMREQADKAVQHSDDITRLMTVVFGNPDIRAKGMADKVDEIAATVKQLALAMEEDKQRRDNARKLFGWLGLRDLPTLIGILGGAYALGSKFGWW